MIRADIQRRATPAPGSEGFSYIELLVASALLLVSLLGLAGMFVSGYANVNGAGDTTLGLAAARQLLEEARMLPYDSLANLDGFDTDNPATLPSSGPELNVARRWRYALAGDGVGWTFTTEEKARWPTLGVQGNSLGAAGTIDISTPETNVTEITVTVAMPGQWRQIEISTRIARL